MSIFDTVIKKKSIFNTVSDIRKQHSTYTKFREAEAAEAEFEAVKAKEDASLLGVLRKPGEVVKGIGQFLFSKEAIEKRATPQEPITFGIPGTGIEIQRPAGFPEKVVQFLGHSILKPQSQQIIDRTENFVSKGIEEDRAQELAVKSVLGETPMHKILANPEFTPEEIKVMTDAMTEHGVYSLFDVLAVMPGSIIGKLGKADDLVKAAKEAYEAQQIIKKAKGVPKGIAPPKKTKSIYNAVIKPKLDTTALKTVEPEIPKKPLKDVVFDLKDDIVKERFALSALREKAGYKYTPKEDKAFNFLNDALYKIDVEKFDDAKQIMRNFEKYREEKGLIPVFKQGQTAMGESASYKYIGDTGWRKGRIDNFGKFIRKTITDFETKKITPKPTKELQPLTQEAKKFKSAEELLNSIKKEPLDVGIDRKNLFEAYKIDESETYIIGKKTGKMIDEPVSIVDTAGKKISERIDKIPEVEYRIATFDKNIDDNLYNSFLRSKDIIKKENLKQQLTDIYNKAVKGVEKPISKQLEPLAQEAKKFKSAEEFVEEVKTEGLFDDNILYHGSSETIKSLSKTEPLSLGEYPLFSKTYGNVITPIRIKPNAKVLDLTLENQKLSGRTKDGVLIKGFAGKKIDLLKKLYPESSDFLKEKGDTFGLLNALSDEYIAIKKYARENNFDAIKIRSSDASATFYAEEIIAINPEAFEILSDKKLTDIYKEAKGVGEQSRALVEVRGEDFVFKGVPKEGRISSKVLARRELERTKKEIQVSAKKAEVKAIKKETLTKAKDIYDKQVAKIKTNKELLQRRRSFIKAVQKQFGLSDADLRTITQRDIRLMSNVEFKTFLDDVRTKSEHLAVTNQARSELIDQITTKNLNIEPLRQAMKLPSLKNMDLAQIRKLDETLTPYLKDDIFLSKRKLETIEKTELSGIKTYREAREILAKKLGVKPEDLNNIKIGEFDRFKGHSALAEKDPFFRMVIEETSKVRLIREAEFLEIEKTLNNLAKKLKTSLVEKFIPQQKNIRRWFEATDKSAIHLTQEELEVVKFMQGEWIKARDYLVKIQAFNKGIKAENYFTHIRRGILEAVKEDGIVKATKEVFNQYRLDEQVFNILDRETGQIMALEKFFQFAMKRTGELKPTENIIEAFRVYMRTFKKKQALDEIVPLIDTYAHVLTPKETTKSGLLLHGDLQRFMKEWLNTQKGRRITLIAKQGGKIEWGLKAGRTLTTLLDIGLNIPVTVATQVGEQVISYQLLGKGKYLLSKIRAITPKGKRITAKYRNLIGKNPWSELIEPARKVGDRLNESIFVAFRDANVRRNRNVMLGSMTKEEWASETLSPERLANMKIEIGRYGVMDDAKSIIGATPEAGVFTQYKTWAIPILGAVTRNIKYLSKYLATLSKLESVRGKRALSEFYRLIELLAFVGITYALIRPDQKDESMIGKIKQRAFQEATTMIQAIEPKMFTSVTRLQSFVKDLGEIAHSLYTLEKYQVSKFGKYAAGELKGLKQLIKLFTPRAIKQFDKDKQKQLTDIKTEILEDIESGKLSVSAAKEKFINEIKKMEQKQKEKRFEMSLGDYKKDLTTRIENKEITTEEGKEEFVEYAKENVDSFESPDEASFVDKIKLYAKAIGIDPVTAFVFIFTDEKIRKIENGAIIVERMPLEESQKVRKERGATRELILDHTLSLQLGGSNRDSNLKLVSVEEWERYTVMENYLGNKLRAGLIEKEEAQKLIKDFKNGIISEEDIIK